MLFLNIYRYRQLFAYNISHPQFVPTHYLNIWTFKAMQTTTKNAVPSDRANSSAISFFFNVFAFLAVSLFSDSGDV